MGMQIDVLSVKSVVPVAGLLDNPASTFIRPNDATAYAQNDLVGNNTTAAKVEVPWFTAVRQPGGTVNIPSVRLYSNHTTGLDTVTFRAELWSAPPTFTNGDNGAYAVATGSDTFLGRYDVTMVQVADGAYGIGTPPSGDGSYRSIKLPNGVNIWWTLKLTLAAGFTPQALKTFTLVPELLLN